MDIKSAEKNANWKKVGVEWHNFSTYFCKNRNKKREKWVKYVEVICSMCEQPFLQKKGNGKKYKRAYCSDKCRAAAIKTHYSGKNHMSWRGGRYKSGHGYILIKSPEHHRADRNGYVQLSVLVVEHELGRELLPDEVAHHKNEIRDDNRPSNLQVLTDSAHKTLHAKQRRERKANA